MEPALCNRRRSSPASVGSSVSEMWGWLCLENTMSNATNFRGGSGQPLVHEGPAEWLCNIDEVDVRAKNLVGSIETLATYEKR